jgi:transposase
MGKTKEVSPMKKSKIYTLEFKQSSAKLAAESDQPIAQTARDLGINENTLHGWIRKYASRLTSSKEIIEANVYEELKRLKKENARLRQERDILKKATAYFAKEAE